MWVKQFKIFIYENECTRSGLWKKQISLDRRFLNSYIDLNKNEDLIRKIISGTEVN